MSSNSGQFIAELSVWALPTIFAIILHEVMHGMVARSLGDDTAARAGRLTLNPLSHIDPLGTIVLPAVLLFLHLPVFGYAKPVPVNFGRLRGGRLGMAAVAAAGPLTNLALAVASAGLVHAVSAVASAPWAPSAGFILIFLSRAGFASVIINVALMVFNLFPLLPLDGGRVLAGLLPYRAARAYSRLEPYGFLILFALLYTNWVGSIVSPIINMVAQALL